VHDKPGTFRRFRDPRRRSSHHLGPIEIETREFAGRLLWPPVKRANAKATPGKRKSGLGAYAASRAYDQHRSACCHKMFQKRVFVERVEAAVRSRWITTKNILRHRRSEHSCTGILRIERAIRRAKFAPDANHSIAAGHVAALARHEPAQHGFDPLV
jgi:hypothetical protein